MTESIYFDDVAYVAALKNMSGETTVFESNLVDLKAELSLLSECVNKYVNGPSNDFANSIKSLFSVGTDLKTSLTGVTDAISAFKTLNDVNKGINALT